MLGISAIETPLKFRAPGITLALGLGIGRLVFRALNTAELALAGLLAVLVAHLASDWPLALFCAITALRPRLDARVQRVIAGDEVPRSSLHIAYIALEGAKCILLPTLGAWLAWTWLA